MTRDQKIVAIGAASGVAAMALAMWMLSTRVLPAPAGMESVGDRLGYALRWAALAALPLFAMIAAIGNARALGAAIDPTLGLEDQAMIVNGRVADTPPSNTRCSSPARSASLRACRVRTCR